METRAKPGSHHHRPKCVSSPNPEGSKFQISLLAVGFTRGFSAINSAINWRWRLDIALS